MADLSPGMWLYLASLGFIGLGIQVAWAWRAQLIEGVKRLLPPPRPTRVRYVAPRAVSLAPVDPPFSPFERAERASFVQPVQALNGDAQTADDITRIDAAARALAVNLAGEAGLIELFFDGVKRGGSKRYADLRDAVRLRAASAYAWTPKSVPAPPARSPLQVAAGRPEAYALDRDSGDRIDGLRAEPAP